MKIETQPREDHQIQILVEVEPEMMERFMRSAARKVAQETKIPGFRPGKAPFDVVRRLVGVEALQQEALDLMMDEVYPQALKESDIKPFAPGTLEKIIEVNPPKFSFIVPLMPSVELGDYKSIRKDYILPEVGDEQIEKTIKSFRVSYSTSEPAGRPAQEGDLVYIKLKGDLTNPAEGEDPLAFKPVTHQLFIGKNDLDDPDWPYEGFSKELIGLSDNEEKTVVHTFADDYEDEGLRGKEVKLEVKAISVKTFKMPELTDEFVQGLGDYSDVEAFKKSIKESLEANTSQDYDQSYMTDVIDQIIAASTIKYPPQALDDEIHSVMHSLEDDLARRRMDMPTYLKSINKDEAAFIESDIKPVAKRRLERGLVMDEIARIEKIELDMTELQNEVMGTMEDLQKDPQFKQATSSNKKMENLTQAVTMDTANRLMNRNVLNRVKSIASGQPETVPQIVLDLKGTADAETPEEPADESPAA